VATLKSESTFGLDYDLYINGCKCGIRDGVKWVGRENQTTKPKKAYAKSFLLQI